MPYLCHASKPNKKYYDYNGIKFTETMFHRVHPLDE